MFEAIMSSFCGITITGRCVELGHPIPLAMVEGMAVAGLSYATFKCICKFDKQKRRPARRCPKKPEYMPDDAYYTILPDGKVVWHSPSLAERDDFFPDKYAEFKSKPLRKVCGAMAEDFYNAPEEVRREFFEGI